MGLALTRERLESVLIGPDIRIDILWIRGNQVRLNITAPSNLKISRGEPLAEHTEPPCLRAGDLGASPSQKTHPDHGHKEQQSG